MSCPTCGHRKMIALGYPCTFCERCGTVVSRNTAAETHFTRVPTLVERVRERDWVIADYALRECVYPPEEKKEMPRGGR